MNDSTMTEAQQADLHVRQREFEIKLNAATQERLHLLCDNMATKAAIKLGVVNRDLRDFFTKLLKVDWASEEMLDKLYSLNGPYGMAIYKAQVARGEIDE